jgi:type VI secretion system protein ImpF
MSVDGRARLMRAVEAALTAFEPRLGNVRVILNSTAGDKLPRIRFTVEGMLRVDPSPEHVSFDTLLEVANGEYKVQS